MIQKIPDLIQESNLSAGYQELLLIKLLEAINSEIKVNDETMAAIRSSAANNTAGYSGSNHDLSTKAKIQILNNNMSALSTIQTVLADYFKRKYVATDSLLNPAEQKTFIHHYLSGCSFTSMYDRNLPTDDEDDSPYALSLSTYRNQNFRNYADRSNTQKKILSSLRGFKAQKRKKEDYEK